MSAVTAPVEPAWEAAYANLRAFIGRRVRNPADVDDLVPRVLLQLVRGLGSLRDRDRLRAWLYRTARNVIVDHYRSSAVRRELASGASSDLAEAIDDMVDMDGEDERTALRELAACMGPMLEPLAPAYRQALMLTEIDGRSQTDVAREMGLSVSGIKSRVQRGRRQLRAALEACCRIELDQRGSVMTAEPRPQAGCWPCGRGR